VKAHIVLAFLIISLASCAPAAIVAPPTNTPAYTPVPPTPTLELTLPPATPLPTSPTIPIFTPDATQVARWKEYQTALGNCVFHEFGDEGGECSSFSSSNILCEWDILGQSGREVYVWAECRFFNGAGRKPLVIYLETNGSIREVRFGGYKEQDYNLELFPADVQEKINLYIGNGINPGRAEELRTHLAWREKHPGEPPLIVLSATPAP